MEEEAQAHKLLDDAVKEFVADVVAIVVLQHLLEKIRVAEHKRIHPGKVQPHDVAILPGAVS